MQHHQPCNWSPALASNHKVLQKASLPFSKINICYHKTFSEQNIILFTCAVAILDDCDDPLSKKN